MTDQQTPESPLSPSALQEAEANLRNWLGTGGVFGESAEQFIVRHRDAVLSAERERLLALTPEQVVEAAAKAMWDSRGLVLDNVPGTVGPMWLGADSFRDLVRAALPVLLGPEVARREQAERDFREELEEHANTIRDEEKATERYIAAESRLAEVERERDAICNHEGGEATLVPSASLKALQLTAQRVTRAEAEATRLREALEAAEGIVSRFVKARDAFHYDNFGGEVERHLERAMEDAYGFLHGLPDDLRAALAEGGRDE